MNRPKENKDSSIKLPRCHRVVCISTGVLFFLLCCIFQYGYMLNDFGLLLFSGVVALILSFFVLVLIFVEIYCIKNGAKEL